MVKDFLSKCLFFSHLNPVELEFVSRTMKIVELKKGEMLFQEGDPGSYVCFVMEGALEIIKHDSFGDEAVIATLVQGNSIGEMCLIDGKPRSASTRAVVNSKLLLLSKNIFDRILKAEPSVGVGLLKGLAVVLSDNLRETSMALSNEMK
ncbi:MAG: cyclic nucleotide-binding domain-containing protein [Gammaproteobacteria bacterium]|nr:cyclic nucleotide-binding domain-containing protein [Gammaproteobacteria bacterium]MDH5694368.1 cyclic nucleotide-binding domain-containing protein [Gammaproteobacteria bacterium]